MAACHERRPLRQPVLEASPDNVELRVQAGLPAPLQHLHLEMMSWSAARALTGTPSPHTYEIGEAGMRGAAAVLVIFSPDDIARVRDDLADDGDPDLTLHVDFEWTMPDVRPDLVVTDGMIAPNAAGEVTLKDGAPVSYVVASDDTVYAVAQRFGTTSEELMFVNPARQNATATPRDQLVA